MKAKFIDIDNVLFHNSHIMPCASQRYSEDTIVSNHAEMGDDGAFVELLRTLIGQAGQGIAILQDLIRFSTIGFVSMGYQCK